VIGDWWRLFCAVASRVMALASRLWRTALCRARTYGGRYYLPKGGISPLREIATEERGPERARSALREGKEADQRLFSLRR